MFSQSVLLSSISDFLLATVRISQQPGACFRRKHRNPKWIASFGTESSSLPVSVSTPVKWLSALWREDGNFAGVW